MLCNYSGERPWLKQFNENVFIIINTTFILLNFSINHSIWSPWPLPTTEYFKKLTRLILKTRVILSLAFFKMKYSQIRNTSQDTNPENTGLITQEHAEK